MHFKKIITVFSLLVVAILLSLGIKWVYNNFVEYAIVTPSSQLAQVSIPTQNLVSYWDFNEGSGTTISDSVGNNSGSFIGNPTWTNGKIGGAISLDGNSYLKVPYSSNYDFSQSGSFTVSAWIKANSNNSLQFIVQQSYGYKGWFFGLNSNGILNATYNFPKYSTVNGGYIQTGTWYHVAFVCNDGNEAKLYINGSQTGSAPCGTPSMDKTPLTIGSDTYGGNYFNGDIDDVRIYNRALSASEILQLTSYTDNSSGGGTILQTDTSAPSVPTNLNSSNITQTGTTITWTPSTDNVGVVGYKIYRNGIQINTVLDTTFTDSNLTANTTYSYSVLAYDLAGNSSAQSNTISINTEAIAVTTYQVSVSTSGSGTVTSSGGSINCGNSCSTTVSAGQTITLTANPSPSSTFTNWGGVCSGSSPTCTLTINSNQNIYAVFNTIVVKPNSTNLYVTSSGSGSGNGADWNNAFAGLPSTLIRGNTYYLAPGNYGSYTADDPISGSQWIIIKRATANDHGTDIGWQNNYSSGTAIFSSQNSNPAFSIQTSYFEINGQFDGGIKVTNQTSSANSSTVFNVGPSSSATNNINIKYIDIAGPGISNGPGALSTNSGYNALGDDVALFINGSGGMSNLLVTHSRIHGSVNVVKFAGSNSIVTNSIFEYNKIYDATIMNVGPQAHPNIFYLAYTSDNITLRYNEFYNWNSEGLLFGSGTHTHWYVYNNLWHDPIYQSCARIIEAQYGQDDIHMFNNTFAGAITHGIWNAVQGGSWSSTSEAKNNIIYLYDPKNPDPNGCGLMENNISNAAIHSNNIDVTSSSFVNPSLFDYHLIATSPAKDSGTTLNSTYSSDFDGNTHGSDGIWDVGAYEYTGGIVTSIPKDTSISSLPSNLNSSDTISSVPQVVRELPLFTRTLKKGLSGTDVKNLQIFLNNMGYIVATKGNGSLGKETKYYGPATANAVSKFQESYKELILIPLSLESGSGIFGASSYKVANLLISTGFVN